MKNIEQSRKIIIKLSRCVVRVEYCNKCIVYLNKQILEAKLYNFKFEYENEIKSLEKGKENFIKIYNHYKQLL